MDSKMYLFKHPKDFEETDAFFFSNIFLCLKKNPDMCLNHTLFHPWYFIVYLILIFFFF